MNVVVLQNMQLHFLTFAWYKFSNKENFMQELVREDLEAAVNNIPDYIKKLIINTPGLVVAGEFIRNSIFSKPTNITLCGLDRSVMESAIRNIESFQKEGDHLIRSSSKVILNSATFSIDIGRRSYHTLNDIINSFNFTIDQALIFLTRGSKPFWKSLIGNRFYPDLAVRRIYYIPNVYNNYLEVCNNVTKIQTLLRKGYVVSNETLTAVFTSLAERLNSENNTDHQNTRRVSVALSNEQNNKPLSREKTSRPVTDILIGIEGPGPEKPILGLVNRSGLETTIGGCQYIKTEINNIEVFARGGKTNTFDLHRVKWSEIGAYVPSDLIPAVGWHEGVYAYLNGDKLLTINSLGKLILMYCSKQPPLTLIERGFHYMGENYIALLPHKIEESDGRRKEYLYIALPTNCFNNNKLIGMLKNSVVRNGSPPSWCEQIVEVNSDSKWLDVRDNELKILWERKERTTLLRRRKKTLTPTETDLIEVINSIENSVYNRENTKWAIYRNRKRLQFLATGPDNTHKTPPLQYPIDTSYGKGREFVFCGWLDLENRKIIEAHKTVGVS